MVISGAMGSNQSFSVVTLKDWKERTRSQAEILAELNKKSAHIPEVALTGFNFPEINTGEQGPPIGFVISTASGYEDLANVAENFLQEMKNPVTLFIPRWI